MGELWNLRQILSNCRFLKNDGWGAFIKQGWSLVLARKFPDKLDLHYSAEKVARNLIGSTRPDAEGKTDEGERKLALAEICRQSLTEWMQPTGVQLLL